MQEQLRSCSATITSLLEMVRDVPLSRTRFELEELLVECLQRTPPAAGVDVQFALPTKLLVYADRDQINAVLSNLLRNAFEAISTTPEKVVRLHASEAAGGVELIVEDSGIGVDAAHRSSIFEVLFTTRAKGTGLGLALCKKIIERHGGEISLLPSQQRGARFRLWLPPAPVSSRENGPHGET
jgi:signal transduction histidine kinase